MKKRNDSGFTLIELMIVIAVIGILAIVLVPKVGTVKTQSKAAGLDTNVRLVQGYVESKIDKWVSRASTNDVIHDDIIAAFTGPNKALTNPFTSVNPNAPSTGDASSDVSEPALFVLETTGGLALGNDGTDDDYLTGTIVVAINGANNDDDSPADGRNDSGLAITGINIYAYDEAGAIISEKTVNITP